MPTFSPYDKRAVDQVLPTIEVFDQMLAKAAAEGKQLRGYLGVDPTSPHLHIGHTVALRNLARFQQAGHKAILLIGDFTGRLGDPDKIAIREPLTKERIKQNMATYLDQAGHLLDFAGDNPVEVRYNSEWSDPLTYEEIIKLAAHFTVQQMLERDMFQKRLQEQRPISLSEFFYPLMQGYDAVALEADVQFGGTDQIFNMLAGRTLNKAIRETEMMVVASPLLADGNGVKIGKTMGNAINIDNSPTELYGQMMSLPDEVIVPGLRLLTAVPMAEVEAIETALTEGSNPMAAKKQLAWEVVTQYHSSKLADEAAEYFEQTVQNKELPSNLTTAQIKKGQHDVIDLLVELHLTDSKANARRLLEQGAIELDGQRVTERTIDLEQPAVLKVGKRQYVRLEPNQ